MNKATKYDKKLVVDIIVKTFENNPGVNWMLKQKGNHKKRIKRLSSYAFIKSYLRGGAYISSNKKGVALCYKFNHEKPSFIELLYQLRFALTSIKLTRLPKVLKRESYRNSIRPESGEYLYFWFLGVLPDGQEAVYELREAIFQEAIKDNLPIYLETALERNQRVYERYGFKTYHYWEDKSEDIKFWFMKWEPGKTA